MILLAGHNNLPDGVVLSVPVTLSDGRWSVILDVTVGDDLKDRLRLCANELEKVRLAVYKVLDTF